MTNYSNQDFNTGNFSEPMVEQRRGGRAFLFSCGGLSLVAFLICCCCAVVVAMAARQPQAVVTLWGAGAQQNWTYAENFVCDGGEAAVLTERYKQLGVKITDFVPEAPVEDAENTIVASGTLQYQETTTNWKATFYLLEEGSGLTPLCIDNIVVSEGDIAAGTNIDNPDADAENSEADEENATSDE